MTKSLNDKIKALGPKRRKKVEARAAELIQKIRRRKTTTHSRA